MRVFAALAVLFLSLVSANCQQLTSQPGQGLTTQTFPTYVKSAPIKSPLTGNEIVPLALAPTGSCNGVICQTTTNAIASLTGINLLSTANTWLAVNNFSVGLRLSGGSTVTSVSGNSGKLQTVVGSVINGGCPSGDSNGNIIWGAGPCVSSSSGVTAGTIGQAAYYASTGSVVSGTSVGALTYQSTGGNTSRSGSARANDQGINILDFGADPTNAADSTTAIQAAIDYTFQNKPARAVYCPAGNYKVSLPLFLDPPGSMRGPDGTNGHAWNGSSDTYSINDMVNFSGVPYVSLQNSNFNHEPDISPTFWRPLNWDASHTYATGDLVRSSGQIWKSTQNSNLNNTPGLGAGTVGPPGLPWQAFWNNSFLQSSFSTTFTGEPGLGSQNNGQGCTLKYTYNNAPGIIIGAIDGNLLANLSMFSSAYSYRGLNAANGIGVAIASDGGGASHTKVVNVEIDGFLTGGETGFNGIDGLGEENTWEKVVVGDCSVAFSLGESQNYINSVYDGGANCLDMFIATAGPSFNIYGGDYSPIPTRQNIFTLGSTAIVDGGQVGGVQTYTITTTLSGGCNGGCATNNWGTIATDPNIANCSVNNPNNIGNCVYNAWVIKLPGWGTIPLTMTAYNFSTKAATFTIDASWTVGMGNWDAMSGCPGSCVTDFSTEVVAATTIYAVEKATIFTGISFNVSGIHIEPTSGGCIQFLQDQSGFANVLRGSHFVDVLFQYPVGNSDFRNQNQTTDPQYGIFACQESKAFIDVAGGSAGWSFHDSSFSQNEDPIIIVQPQIPDLCVFENQGHPLTNVVLVQNANANSTGPCWFRQPPPVNGGGRGNIASFAGGLMAGMHGWVPTPWANPRLGAADFTTLQSITSGNAINSYSPIYGNTIYSVLDYTGANAKLVQSNHTFASYGRNITTSDNASLSWSYKGGSIVVNMDSQSLSWMFPGMIIGLDNGTGNKNYFVAGVFPHNSLDGGTHPGYVQVFGPVSAQTGSSPNGGINQNNATTTLLVGTSGTTYNCPGNCSITQISQQPFAWQQISLAQPVGTPVLSSCGTSPALASGSTNLAGAFTTGTATPTACTVTFSSAFQNNANCAISAANTAANGVGGTYVSAQSTSAFTVTLGTGTNSAKYNYVCSGS